jgi:hypothetical protein
VQSYGAPPGSTAKRLPCGDACHLSLTIRIEPLSPSHDRIAFRSGVLKLDGYLHHQAGQDARRKTAAPFVLVDAHGSILGYYTLSAYSIRLDALPNVIGKRLPRSPLIPATLLGRLTVSAACRGQRLKRFLLMDALHRSWRNTTEVASVGVVHQRYGIPLPPDLNRLEETIQSQIAEAAICIANRDGPVRCQSRLRRIAQLL